LGENIMVISSDPFYFIGVAIGIGIGIVPNSIPIPIATPIPKWSVLKLARKI